MCFSTVSVLCFPLSPCDRPRVIESMRGIEVIDVAAGGAHSACITATGELYTWGKGRYGRLGHGDSEDQLKPKPVCFTEEPRASAVCSVVSSAAYRL